MFGRYELHDVLGRGGMGEVFRAVDTVRDRTVALKLLPKHLATDESFKTRFRRESRTAARLNDPHIIPIHDFGEIDGQLFIDMRLVEGRDLGSVLADRGSLSATTGVKIISQVASALEAAHQSGLVHRDVKPSNVLLAGWTDSEEDDPFAYLVDFGIARAANQEGTALTATSGTVGTVAYMSPERIGGSPGDRRTDIYALGCVLYETLAGRKPFDGEIFAIMYAHMNTPPPRLSEHAANTPRALDDVIAKAMAKDPDDRYATTSEFALAARQALRSAPPQSVGPSPVAPPTGAAPSSAPPTAPAAPPAGLAGQPAPPHPSAPIPQYLPQPPSGPIRERSAAQTTHRAAGQFAPPLQGAPPSPPPGPVRPTSPSQPVRPPSWAAPPPPPHVSGPIGAPPTLPPPPAPRGRRRMLIGTVAVLAVAAIVLGLVFALGGSSNKPQAQNSSSSPVASSSSSSTAPQPATYQTGGPSTPVVSWDHFGSFSRLVGTRNGDSAHAFQDGKCTLGGILANDPTGLLDQVQCTYQSSPVTSGVARFQNQQQVLNYLGKLSDHMSYALAPFTINGRVVGLRYTPPASAADVNVITYLCGLPNYLVQFYAPDKNATPLQSVVDNYWSGTTFPDVVPEECNPDFSGIKSGSTPTLDGVGAIKTVTSVPDSVLQAWVQRQRSDWSVSLVDVPTGAEMIVVGQMHSVSFWQWDSSTHEISLGGYSTYPYDVAALGQPQATAKGALLTGMNHATFIVTGHFSGDGSGNAVAYTYSTSKGWGAIKAQQNGNLAPSGQGVAVSGIGLSQDFDFVNGLLETADCSSSIPISDCGGNNRVLKYWSWNGSQFILDHTAGLSH